MSLLPRADNGSSLQAPPIDLGRAFRQACVWLGIGFAVTVVVLFAGTWVLTRGSDSPPDWFTALMRCAVPAGVVGLIFFVARFLWHTPTILAKVFAVTAFAATMFGLVVLVVFFIRLGLRASAWFEVTPPQLAARNEKLLRTIGSEEQAAKMKLFLERLEAAREQAAKEKQAKLAAAKSSAEKAEIGVSAERELLCKLSEAALAARSVPFPKVKDGAPADKSAKAAEAKDAKAEAPAPPKLGDKDFDSIVPDFARTELDGIDEQMNKELQATPKPEEKAAIEKDYAEIRGAKVKDLIPSLQENVQIFQKNYVKDLSALNLLRRFFVNPPSHEAMDAGVMPALLGSIYLGLIAVLVAVPLGVGAAVYLEEYKWTQNWFWKRFFYVLQTNINNLAGIPSIVYGIFGALVFVELIFKPLANVHPGIEARNALGGGLTLALLTLPVVIVAAQEAIRAVPQSLRHGALALGATKWQVIRHLVLPNAIPGIMTGTILAMSRALGEAAPLVFFGALLYKPDPPSLFSDFTVLPMQIFGWTSKPEAVWLDNAAMASFTLLFTVLLLNALAIYIRQRMQKRARW